MDGHAVMAEQGERPFRAQDLHGEGSARPAVSGAWKVHTKGRWGEGGDLENAKSSF